MIEAYLQQEKERAKLGIPALPLTPEQTADLCELLRKPPKGKEAFLLSLLKDRVSPGVDPSAKVKAEFLAGIVSGKVKSPLVSAKDAVAMLGTMIGGYNVAPLVAALKDKKLADDAAKALSGITLVYDAFDEVAALASLAGAVNTATSVEIGKILGINLVLVGTVRVLAADGSKFHIQLRLVNVESSELVATMMATGDPGIGYRAATEMAKKLKTKFNTEKKAA